MSDIYFDSKLGELYEITDVVRLILLNVPEARNDDKRLFYEFYKIVCPNLLNYSYKTLLRNNWELDYDLKDYVFNAFGKQFKIRMKGKRVPDTKSIERARRKVQEIERTKKQKKDWKIQPKKIIQKLRNRNEDEYIEYAITEGG